MWVVTKEYNDYNQHGEYFVAVYKDKPTFQQLKETLQSEDDVTIGKLTRGGGRQNIEDEWYSLIRVEEGENYDEH